MTLDEHPFALIQEGTKTIEIRLFDEKRKKLAIGDEIEFSCGQEKIHTKIVSLSRYTSFKELFNTHSPTALGTNDWKTMRQYYTKEDEERYGVLGIGIKLI